MDTRPRLLELPTYDVSEKDWEIKLNANESNLNLPPLVAERVMNRLSQVAFHRYPVEELEDLKTLLAAGFGLAPENVLVANGSSEILEKLFFAFGGSGRRVVFPTPSFSMYHIYAKLSEAEAVPVELEEDFSLDAEKFIAAVKKSEAKLAVLCTPNNPTGNVVALADVAKIAAAIDCPLAVDEAYVEFYGRSAASLLQAHRNLIVCRTFSKAYGLASARVGYMLAAPEIARAVGKLCMPYHVNTLTLTVAGAVYQMRDEFVPRIQMTVAERKRVLEALAGLPGLTAYPSETNFVLVRCGAARELEAYLAARGIGVRAFGAPERLRDCLRVTVGTREENDCWLRAARDFAGGR